MKSQGYLADRDRQRLLAYKTKRCCLHFPKPRRAGTLHCDLPGWPAGYNRQILRIRLSQERRNHSYLRMQAK
jgi:hypothetical protein